jgi:quercetin dioxygenase-like cupin family protein
VTKLLNFELYLDKIDLFTLFTETIMFQPKHIQHLTVKKLFLYKDAPYMIYRHQVDGDHINHIHDHDFLELVMISEGTGTQSTPSCDIPMRTGALFVLQPGVWHAYLDCKALLVNVCLIDTRVFDSELAWMRDNPLLHCILWEAAITESQTPIHYLNAQQTNTGKRAFYALQALEQIQTPPSSRAPDWTVDYVSCRCRRLGIDENVVEIAGTTHCWAT